MGLDYKKREKAVQKVKSGVKYSTGTLDATTTTEEFHDIGVLEKVTFQANGTLAGTVEFSLDGSQWSSSTAIGAVGALVTFSTHLVCAIKVTRTGGTGKLAIAGK
jgi:hypothetical protein